MDWDFDRYDGYVKIGSVVAGIAAFIYRKVFVNTAKWIVSVMRAPGSVDDIRTLIFAIKKDQEDTKLMAQASWDAIEKPVWRSDENGLCVHVNRRFLEVLECQLSDVTGNSWRSFIHQDDKQKVYAEWDMSVVQRRDFGLRYRWVSKTGKVIHINAFASRMIRSDGTLAGWVAFVEIEPTPPVTP